MGRDGSTERAGEDLVQNWLLPGAAEAVRSADLAICLRQRGDEGRTPPTAEQLARLGSAMAAGEQRLARLQQLASIGVMAASVAHEARNATTGAHGCAQLLKAKQGDVDELIEALERETKRCVEILSRFLQASREPAAAARVDVGALVEEAVSLARHHLKLRNVAIPMDSPSQALFVEGSPAELRQVLLNLMLNAQQAMPDGGEVRVTTSGDAGGQVVIRVADDGPGVPLELAERIFEPFCTTKPAGEGVGLGLAMSRKIVEQHGGTLSLEPTAPPGATFTIRLPTAG